MKNNRTFLEKLLDGAEVEWKPLKEIAEYIRGVTYNKTNESPNNIGYKILRANNITLSSNTLNFDDIKVIKFDTKVKSSQMLYKNDILISAASGSREHVGKVAFIYQDIDYYFGGFMGVIRCNNNVNSRYLFHIFTSSIFQDYLNEVLNSSTINNLNSKVMDSFRLPIPPLSVQTEIVQILDALTALTCELTSELTLRRKQYEYYREKLLSFDSLEQLNMGGAKKKLIDVAIYAKVRILADKLDKENYVGVENLLQNKLGKTSSNYVPTDGAFIEYLPNDILIGNIRPYLRKIWLSDRKGGTNGDVLVIRLTDENILPRYLYHILANEHFFEYNVKYSKGAKMPRGDKAAILQYEFDVPPLEEQHRIVSILDKFETLTNSITEGLPLAIEQSQKRYEYYRELLLSF